MNLSISYRFWLIIDIFESLSTDVDLLKYFKAYFKAADAFS